MNTRLIDCHSHTALSGHGEGTIEQAVRRAQELGLRTYVQTEHLVLPAGMDPHYEDSMAPHVLKGYVHELKRQRKRLAVEKSPLQLVVGIEADWLNGREAELQELCEPFEYVIGSVHYLDGWAFDNPETAAGWEERGAEYVWRRYFEVWKEMATSRAPITTFGHIDLPKVFGTRPPFDATNDWREMAALCKERDAMIELNTAGWRKPVAEQYPSLEVLQIFAAAGVPCTVGADAHKPADIAAGVPRAYEILKTAGYTRVAVPNSDGSRAFLAL